MKSKLNESQDVKERAKERERENQSELSSAGRGNDVLGDKIRLP